MSRSRSRSDRYLDNGFKNLSDIKYASGLNSLSGFNSPFGMGIGIPFPGFGNGLLGLYNGIYDGIMAQNGYSPVGDVIVGGPPGFGPMVNVGSPLAGIQVVDPLAQIQNLATGLAGAITSSAPSTPTPDYEPSKYNSSSDDSDTKTYKALIKVNNSSKPKVTVYGTKKQLKEAFDKLSA